MKRENKSCIIITAARSNEEKKKKVSFKKYSRERNSMLLEGSYPPMRNSREIKYPRLMVKEVRRRALEGSEFDETIKNQNDGGKTNENGDERSY